MSRGKAKKLLPSTQNLNKSVKKVMGETHEIMIRLGGEF